MQEIAERYQKKLLQLRLNAAFLTDLIAAARRGRVLMIVSNTGFFSAFRQNLINLGIAPATLDRISALAGDQRAEIGEALAQARYVYISPICDQRLRQRLPPRVKELRFESILADESVETMEAMLLFYKDRLPSP